MPDNIPMIEDGSCCNFLGAIHKISLGNSYSLNCKPGQEYATIYSLKALTGTDVINATGLVGAIAFAGCERTKCHIEVYIEISCCKGLTFSTSSREAPLIKLTAELLDQALAEKMLKNLAVRFTSNDNCVAQASFSSFGFLQKMLSVRSESVIHAGTLWKFLPQLVGSQGLMFDNRRAHELI